MQSAPTVERRFVEFRAEGDTLSGTVIRYGDTATFGRWREQFQAGSIRPRDVVVNLHHDRAQPVAREGAGLQLTDGPDELRATVTLPDTRLAREARELVDAGILRGFSMEFRVRDGGESWEGNQRTIRAADLVGLALVDKPAYSASVIARHMDEQAPPERRKPRFYV